MPPVRSARSGFSGSGIDAVALAERTLVVGALVFLAGAVQAPLTGYWGPDSQPASELVTQVTFAPFYAFAAVMVAATFGRAGDALRSNAFLSLLPIFCLLSVMWSVSPGVTVRRAVALNGTFLFGLYLALRFTMREFLALISYAMAASALIALITVLVRPDLGVMTAPHEGAWRGAFLHKNILGRAMGLGVMSSIAALSLPRAGRIGAAVSLLLCLALLAASQSRTAWLATASAIAILGGATVASRVRPLVLIPAAFAALAGFVAIGWFISANAELLLLSLGRDATLSGRTALWVLLASAIASRPLLGFGYGAYWSSGQVASSGIQLLAGWDVPHAHSGVLDALLDVGVLGALLAIVGFVVAFARSLALARVERESASGVALLSLIAVLNLAESVLLRHHSVFLCVLVFVAYRGALLKDPARS